jgi:hypothetical protein
MHSRLTIRLLMGLVLFVAVGVAALRHASELWASLLLTAALLLFAVAALGAACSRGPRRAACGGFAAFGFGYLALCFGPWASTEVRPHLATSKLLDFVGAWISRTSPPVFVTRKVPVLGDVPHLGRLFATRVAAPGPARFAGIGPVAATANEPFVRVGHSLFALIFALLGGLVARYFSAAREHEPGDPGPAGAP